MNVWRRTINMLKKTLKPPLGVKPKFIWDEERIKELKGAILRYIDSNWPIPLEFVEEYNDLTETMEIENDK